MEQTRKTGERRRGRLRPQGKTRRRDRRQPTEERVDQDLGRGVEEHTEVDAGAAGRWVHLNKYESRNINSVQRRGHVMREMVPLSLKRRWEAKKSQEVELESSPRRYPAEMNACHKAEGKSVCAGTVIGVGEGMFVKGEKGGDKDADPPEVALTPRF
uniref:Uncharacterized protein n=1 Tax=Mycena chlorophos TaxID=658473 RepID=A0ABQ0LMJ7_MYCCL|nr:predicted protein [Mycena chlorophos]